MAKRLVLGTIAVLVLLVPTSALAGGGEINLLYGEKSLDSDWKPFDSQSEVGIELTFGHDWPVSIAVDYLTSDDDRTYSYYGYSYKVKAETTEIDLGVRKLFMQEKKIQPFIGGGLAFIDGEIRASGLGGFSDDATGYWLDGGVMFRIRRFNLGIELRDSSADVKFSLPGGGGLKLNAGGFSWGVLLGYRWGGS